MGDWKVCSVQSRQKKNPREKTSTLDKESQDWEPTERKFPIIMEGLIRKIRKLIFFQVEEDIPCTINPLTLKI